MKCPKCGFSSFESYDSCRKCATDLTEFKRTHNIIPIILPPALSQEKAAALGILLQSANDETDEASDSFQLDLTGNDGDQQAEPPNPFTFTDEPQAAADDPFASLMGGNQPDRQQPAMQADADDNQGFELNSFSWDDTPAPGQDSDNSGDNSGFSSSNDELSSLFGDLSDPARK